MKKGKVWLVGAGPGDIGLFTLKGMEVLKAADVVVYNREFRVKNLKENIAGVFTLGQATIEEIQALEIMKEQRKKLDEENTKRENTLEKKKKKKE